MAEKKIYLGSVGPFLYDDADLIADYDGDFDGEYRKGLTTNGQLFVDEVPSEDNNIVRLTDLTGRVLTPVAVTDIDDPSTELNALSGIAGSLVLVYEVGDDENELTLYVWDNAVGTGENVPYVVAGSSGFWIAIAGKYNNLVKDHNDLTGLQGGNGTDEYYHLLLADYTELSEWLDNVTLGSNGLTSVPEVVLVPRAAALSDTQGGMYYSNVDDSIYVCTSAA